MISFGRLVLALCTRSLTVNNYAKALEHVARAYSADLKNAIIFLMSPHSPHKASDLLKYNGFLFICG